MTTENESSLLEELGASDQCDVTHETDTQAEAIPMPEADFMAEEPPADELSEEILPDVPVEAVELADEDIPTDVSTAPDGESAAPEAESPADDPGEEGAPVSLESAPPEAPAPLEKPKKKKAAKKSPKESADAEQTEDLPDGLAQEDTAADPPLTAAEAVPPNPPKRAAPKPKPAPKAAKKSLLSLKLNDLDRDLSEEERQEWNEIYASFRAKSVLTGTIVGVDSNEFTVKNRDTGVSERKKMFSVVVIKYRVKILIPETEMWMPGEERPDYVLRNMVGGQIDYAIMDVDREGECAIASRRMAQAANRHYFATVRGGRHEGDRLQCRVLAVGPKRCMVECGGRDITLTQRDLTYTSTPDLREKYHPGQELPCILKQFDPAGKLVISVKEVSPNPFDGAAARHPVGSRRQAVISGKYGGGVFCTLSDDTVCLCLYSAQHADRDFHEGDTVIIAIRQYDYSRQLIYGRILAKW